MEAVSGEAGSLAGHLWLDNLIFVYDDNHITIDGKTELAFSEDVGKRYEAYGWFVQHIDGHDHAQIRAALDRANAESGRPSLIVARTHIGIGSPKQDSEKAHGEPRVAELVPSLAGGSADLNPSTKTYIKSSPAVARGKFEGRNIHFGIREHAMGAFVNGMAVSDGFIPFGSTFLIFSDYMRASIRLAALSHLQSLFVFTHDSGYLGEDGPTHEPVEQYWALRLIPNLDFVRPADALECAAAWAHALARKNGPTAIALSRQKLANVPRAAGFDPKVMLR